jgi:predicted protein tyrosine phosphatase
MFELKVLGIHKAKTLIAQDWPTHIISVINDAGPNWPATTIDRQHNNHAIYNFHDVEDDDPEEYADLVPPTKKDMQDIIDEVKSWELNDDSKVLIHCSAGKSRSTAIAIAVLVLHGMSPKDALAKVKLLSPAMCPNRLMTQYLDEVIGANGELLKAVTDWYDATIIMIPGLSFPNRGGYNR